MTLPSFRRCKIRKRDPFRDPFLKSNETKEYGKHDLFHHRVNSSVYVCVRVCIYVAANWSRAYLLSLTPRPFIARLTTSYAYSPVRSSRLYRLPSLTTMIDDRRLYFEKGFFFFFFFTPRSKDVIRTAACIRACPTRRATIPFVGGLLTFP